MALFNIEEDFSDDKEHFEKLYKLTYEEFIGKYSDNRVIDLTDKVVVSLRADSERNLPMDILAIFIPEEERLGYKATLIYSGHIAFLKIERNSGKVQYFYKDDECCPITLDELLEGDTGDIVYCCEEKGFNKKDIVHQIELFIQSQYDLNYVLEGSKLVILEGL